MHTDHMRTNSTVGPDGEQMWPSPIRDGEWLDAEGVRWRIRGHPIGERETRRLLKRPELRVLHVFGEQPREVTGSDLARVLQDLATFHRGEASPYADFCVAEFRDEERRPLLVVEESC